MLVRGWRRWTVAMATILAIAAVQWFGPGWNMAGASALVGVALSYFGFDVGKAYFRQKEEEGVQ